MGVEIVTEIEGYTPLLLNRFTDEAAERATSGNSSAIKTSNQKTPREQAEQGLYIGADGETLIIPQPNLLRCIIEGGRFHKCGKKQITTKAESLLYACLDILEVEIRIQHKEPWRVDTRPVRIPSTGGRILKHRPMFDDWKLRFTLAVDTEIISFDLVRMIVDDAGKRVGLGDFRPATKGPYGKFRVVLWEKSM